MATPVVSVTPYAQPKTWYVKAGVTLSGYDPYRPNQTFLTYTMKTNSSALADAEVWISWPGVTNPPIPRGGPFLRVTSGTWKGYLIVKSLVSMTPYTTGGGLPHTLDRLAYPARYQFGQGGPCGGSSCCTDTCVQMLIEYWKEKTYTLSNIRYWAQIGSGSNTSPCTGINAGETLQALQHYGITWYKVATGIDANFVKSKLSYGPVLVGVYYGSYPNTTGGRCGSSNKALRNGRTDCGFYGAHAVLALGTTSGGTYCITRDPDHNSLARPEKPDYDIITWAQLDKTMKDLPRYTNWNLTYCMYPIIKKVL